MKATKKLIVMPERKPDRPKAAKKAESKPKGIRSYNPPATIAELVRDNKAFIREIAENLIAELDKAGNDWYNAADAFMTAIDNLGGLQDFICPEEDAPPLPLIHKP
jgi:hypothetical protein